MNYNEFQETLFKELESRLDSHISLNPITTTKNNNTLKHGIEFSNDTSNISPVLYLDEWYEFYLTGKSLSLIAEDIVELYHQAADVSFTDTEMLLNYEKLQEKRSSIGVACCSSWFRCSELHRSSRGFRKG